METTQISVQRPTIVMSSSSVLAMDATFSANFFDAKVDLPIIVAPFNMEVILG